MDFKSKSRRSGFTLTTQKPDILGAFLTEALQEFIIMWFLGFWVWLKAFGNRGIFWALSLSVAITLYSYDLVLDGRHLAFLRPYLDTPSIKPMILTLYHLPFPIHYGTVVFCLSSPIFLLLGLVARGRRTKFQQIFTKLRLQNGLGDTPKLVGSYGIGRGKRCYIFDLNGVSLGEIESRKAEIEGYLKTNIESMNYGKHKGLVVILTNNKPFPSKVSYSDLEHKKKLPKDSFYLGATLGGIETQCVADLPHMLIAGTTGSGKSVFFKQALLGILESSPHLQMYLIDLKGGLEMIDFAAAANVRVVKEMTDAVSLLKLVEKEMKSRFQYLEKNQQKQIVPAKHSLDRIVVAVDEASVLYSTRTRQDPDYEASLEARRLADSISKLSRAAAIHLLIATQKLDKQVIPTSVSENISGRIAFRANSLQGSMIVLGTKEASELPEIPGRGIWNFGTKKSVVQAPFVDEEIIQQKCMKITEEFQSGQRKFLSPMLVLNKKEANTKKKDQIYEFLEEGE